MKTLVIGQTDKLTLTSHGNGWGYELAHSDGRSIWLQDDDAYLFRIELEALEHAHPDKNALPALWAMYEDVASVAP